MGRYSAVIIAPNWLGDFVMALPSMHALCERYSGECTVVIRPFLADIKPVLPDAHIHVTDKPFLRMLASMRVLHHTNPECVVVYPMSFRAALLGLGTGAPIRIGISYPESSWALTRRIESPDRSVHMARMYAALARAAGADASEELPVIDEDLFPVPGMISETSGGYMVIAPGATFGTAKRWFPDRYGELSRLLSTTYSCRIVLVGTKRERSYLERIRQWCPDRVENLAGMTTIPELIGILSNARLFIGNDSGAAHAAALARTPGVVIFGSSSPVWTRPLWHGVSIVYEKQPCSPCYQRECPLTHLNCLKQISTEDVYHQCQKVLKTNEI